MNQKDVLEANVGNPSYYSECKSLFPCSSPLESTKGWADKLGGDSAKAKQLLQQAGYDGTPVVLLHQTDVSGHNNLATVAKVQLERAGFKVDLQPMDWQTPGRAVAPRRTRPNALWPERIGLVHLMGRPPMP